MALRLTSWRGRSSTRHRAGDAGARAQRPPPRPGASPPPSRAGKASVTAYFAPTVRRQLRRLAADRDTTLQALLGEAVNDLFAKHGLPELVERD